MVEIGETINAKYRVIRLIGEGGMGTVYEARHELLGINVALKFLHPDIAEQGSLKQRFMQEARVSASIKNPHIVRILDVDSADGSAFLVMELLEGEPLSNRLERTGALPVSTAFAYMLQVLDGVAAAHALGIVHRDLKPDNVFITPVADGGVLIRILDFGIAKLRQSSEYKMTLTRPGAVMGTPEYMAPEQAYSADLADTRSDVYSLGVMLFEMLSGKRPVEGDNPQQIAEQILTGKVRRLDRECQGLAPGLVKVVHVAMSADPDHRWQDAAAVRDALLPFLPLDRATAETGLQLDSSAFAAIARTPRIDGSMALKPQSPKAATRVDGPAKLGGSTAPSGPVTPAPPIANVVTPSSPATAMPRERTAPPDSRPHPAFRAEPQKTVNMSGRRAGPGGNVKKGSEAPRRATSLKIAALVSLLLGAGVGLQVYLSRESDIPEPPRPVRRSAAPAIPAAPALVESEPSDEDDEDLATPRVPPPAALPPNAAARPHSDAEPPAASALPANSAATPQASSPSWVTLPAIPLPALPSGISFPTSLPVSVPTFLQFPAPPSQP